MGHDQVSLLRVCPHSDVGLYNKEYLLHSNIVHTVHGTRVSALHQRVFHCVVGYNNIIIPISLIEITIGFEVTSQDITEIETVGTREVCAVITEGILMRRAVVNLVHADGTALGNNRIIVYSDF